MKFAGSALAALIVVAITAGDDPTLRTPIGSTTTTRLGERLPEPPNAPIHIGDPVPDFEWTGAENQSRRLHDVLEQAHALVVFAPSDEVLRRLEAERETLGLMGVIPVAVIEARPRSVEIRARRSGAHFLMIPDPVRVIGGQFNQVDARTNRNQPGWFAVDRRGVVRGAGSVLDPPQGWARIAASALALPEPGAPVPASRER